MPQKYYVIELAEGIEIHVYFETLNGLVINFVVKLIVKIKEKYYEVIRYDSAHQCPHKDILDVKGGIIRKVWFDFIDNRQGLDLAIKDLKDNYEMYIERFKKWLRK